MKGYFYGSATLATLLLAEPAIAQGAGEVQINLASEYISKGVGRSDGDPHLSVQFQQSLSDSLTAGVWAGSLSSPLAAEGEVHLYLGWRQSVGPWSFEARPIYKVLLDADGSGASGLWEYRLDGTRDLAGGRVRLRLEHTPDGYGASEGSTWAEAQYARKLGPDWTALVSAGRREQETGRDYSAWSAGVQRRLGDQLTADLRWIDTDARGAGREYRGRLVIGLTARFSP